MVYRSGLNRQRPHSLIVEWGSAPAEMRRLLFVGMSSNLAQYASLDDALAKFGIPDRNRAFIRKFMGGIPIAGYYETSGYIKAVRANGGPDLNIASGWSNGFESEAEIIELLGDVERWGDGDRFPLWGVSHPENRIGHGGGGPSSSGPRDYGTCPTCFTGFSASGQCACG